MRIIESCVNLFDLRNASETSPDMDETAGNFPSMLCYLLLKICCSPLELVFLESELMSSGLPQPTESLIDFRCLNWYS